MKEGLGPQGKEALKKIGEEPPETVPVLAEADRIYEEIYTDERTELPNPKAFARDLKGAIDAVEQGTLEQLTLLMIDIDDFREFNKRYGHQCGNRVLLEIAGILRDNAQESQDEKIRENVTAYRYGGEEFMLIAKNLNPEEMIQLGQQIRERAENKKVEYNGRQIGATLSMGLSSYQKGEDYGQLIEMADSALKRAKEAGKNRLEIAEHSLV